MNSEGSFKRGLEGLVEPTQGIDFEKSELHKFTIRAFTWESKPEDLDMLITIEEMVGEFLKEYLEPAEIIIARFNSDKDMTQGEADRLFLNLQSAIVAIEGEVSRRYLKAQYSYYAWDTKYWEEYRKPVTGTQGDREARGKVETKEDRMFYFVNYAAWRQINDKVTALKQTQKYIQNLLYRNSFGR